MITSAMTNMEQLRNLVRSQEALGTSNTDLSPDQIVEWSLGLREQIDSVMSQAIDEMLHERETWQAAFPGHTFDEVMQFAQSGYEASLVEAKTDEPEPAAVVDATNAASDPSELIEKFFPGQDPADVLAKALMQLQAMQSGNAA